MKEKNSQLKAKLYIGGLKSLFGDLHDAMAEVEKSGQMPGDMIQSLIDVKDAVDLTITQLKRAVVPCCSHHQQPELEGDDDDDDDESEECESECEECGEQGCDGACEEDEEPELEIKEELLPITKNKKKKVYKH
jgi:hypothetical protein